MAGAVQVEPGSPEQFVDTAAESPSETTSPRIRDPRIDALKGFAITLVVLGHAIYTAQGEASSDPLFRAIYAFHMPLFASISGYLFAFGIERRDWLRKRALGVGVPYLAWVVVGFLVGWPAALAGPRTLGRLGHRMWAALLGMGDGGGLWYLYTLLVAAFVIWALRRWEPLLVVVAIGLMLKPYAPSVLFLNELRWVMLPFAVTGFLVARHPLRDRRLLLVSAACFPLLLAAMWPVIETPSWLFGAEKTLATFWPAALPARVSPEAVRLAGFWTGRYLLGLSGIGLSVLVWSRVGGPARSIFARLGTLSLGIYAVHFMWQEVLGRYVGTSALLFATSLLASVATAAAIGAVPGVRFLLLGRRGG